jgi:hypothetical protein
VIAVSVAVWSIEATYAYHMLFFDTLAFLGASLATAASALERRTVITRPTKSSDILTTA